MQDGQKRGKRVKQVLGGVLNEGDDFWRNEGKDMKNLTENNGQNQVTSQLCIFYIPGFIFITTGLRFLSLIWRMSSRS